MAKTKDFLIIIGLGLAIVEDIVKSHGGDIQFSKSVIGGLCVKLFFPL